MTVHYTVEGGRATVRLDRPEVLNALDRPTLEALRDRFREASADHSVGVVVLTGTGERAFCTGADLDEQKAFLDRPNDYWDWMSRFIDAIEAVKGCSKPVVARLNGMAVGGGNELNLACDLAVAADDVVLRHVGPSRGSLPAGGARRSPPSRRSSSLETRWGSAVNGSSSTSTDARPGTASTTPGGGSVRTEVASACAWSAESSPTSSAASPNGRITERRGRPP